MKVLLEAAHPAHVHFFAPIGDVLTSRGHSVALALRDKDTTTDIARRSGLRLIDPPAGQRNTAPAKTGLLRQGLELVRRVWWLRGVIGQQGFDLVMTRNPSGVLAAALTRRPCIFDTDDGTEAGLHYRLAARFATAITIPALLPQDLGPKQHRYPGLKTTVFLHPRRFVPDEHVRDRYALRSGARIIVMRFSANDASHDARVRSVPDEVIARIVSSSSEHHDVVVSREGHGTRLFPSRSSQPEPPVEGPDHRVREVDPSDFLHLLASAEVFVGDSGSVTMEAAALGVPTLRLADTRREIIDQLQDLYGLVEHFDLDETPRFEAKLAAMLGSGSSRISVAEGHHRLIKDSEDVTLWFADLCERFGDTHMRSGAHER